MSVFATAKNYDPHGENGTVGNMDRYHCVDGAMNETNVPHSNYELVEEVFDADQNVENVYNDKDAIQPGENNISSMNTAEINAFDDNKHSPKIHANVENAYVIYPNGRSNTVTMGPELEKYEEPQTGYSHISLPKNLVAYPSPLNEEVKAHNSPNPKKKKALSKRKKRAKPSEVVEPEQLRDRMYHTYYRGYLKEFLEEEMDQLVEGRVKQSLGHYLRDLKEIQKGDGKSNSKLDSNPSEKHSRHSRRNSARDRANNDIESENSFRPKSYKESTDKKVFVVPSGSVSPMSMSQSNPKHNLEEYADDNHQNERPNLEEQDVVSEDSVEIEVEGQNGEFVPIKSSRNSVEAKNDTSLMKPGQNVSIEEIQSILSAKKPEIPKPVTNVSELRSEIDSIIGKLSDLQERQDLEVNVDTISPISPNSDFGEGEDRFSSRSSKEIKPKHTPSNSARKSVQRKQLPEEHSDFASTDDDSDHYYEKLSVPVKPLNLEVLKQDSSYIEKNKIPQPPVSEMSLEDPVKLIPDNDVISVSTQDSTVMEEQENLSPVSKSSNLLETSESPVEESSMIMKQEPSSKSPLDNNKSFAEKLQDQKNNLRSVSSPTKETNHVTEESDPDELQNLDERIQDLIKETGTTLSKEDLMALARVRVPTLVKLYEDLAKGLSKKEALENMTNRAREDYNKNIEKDEEPAKELDVSYEEEVFDFNDDMNDNSEIISFCEENKDLLSVEKSELQQMKKKYHLEKSLYKDKLTEQDSQLHFKTQVCLTLIETQLYHVSRSESIIENLQKDPSQEAFHESLDKWASLEREKQNVKSKLDQQDKEYLDMASRRGQEDEMSRLSLSQLMTPERRDRSGNLSARSARSTRSNRSYSRLTRSPRHGLLRKSALEDDIQGVFEPIDESDPLFLSFERSNRQSK